MIDKLRFPFLLWYWGENPELCSLGTCSSTELNLQPIDSSLSVFKLQVHYIRVLSRQLKHGSRHIIDDTMEARIRHIFFFLKEASLNGFVKCKNVLMIIFLIKMRNLCLKWHLFFFCFFVLFFMACYSLCNNHFLSLNVLFPGIHLYKTMFRLN